MEGYSAVTLPCYGLVSRSRHFGLETRLDGHKQCIQKNMHSSLQCRHIFGTRVHIFLLGHHLRFGNCGGLRRGNICRGSWCKWKNEHQPSIGQASNYNPRWRHRKPDLASVPLQNNACTAGYMHSKDGVRIAHARRASFQIQKGGCVTRVSHSCHQPHLPHL